MATVGFVVGATGALTAGETALRAVIAAVHTVTDIDDSAAVPGTQDAYVISDDCSRAQLGAKYMNQKVVVLKGGSWQDMGMADANNTNQGSTSTWDLQSHEIGTSLGDPLTAFTSSQGGWGVVAANVAAGADVFAVHPTLATHYIGIAFEVGAILMSPGTFATERMVGINIVAASGDDTASGLQSMLLQAITWVIDADPPAVATSLRSELRRTRHSVRLVGQMSDRMITPKVQGLRVRNEDPGGYTSVTFELAQPITSTEIQHFDFVYVTDCRTGELVGAGRLEDPGKAADDNGEIWSLTAIGMGPAHTEDVEQGYVAIDTHLDNFRRVFRNNGPGATAEISDNLTDGESDGMYFQFPGGMDIAPATAAALQYEVLVQTGQQLGAFAGDWDGGFSGVTEIQAGTDVSPEVFSAALTTTGGSILKVVDGGSSFSSGDQKVRVRMRRPGGSSSITVANDTHWASVYNFRIHALIHTKDGEQLVSGSGVYNDDWILASEIIEDLLGRGDRLPFFDGARATVEATTFHINQFAYPDPVKVSDLLTDLMGIEGAFTWHVWESSVHDTDLWNFEWVAKPTTVKYEASVIDGFSRPSTASEVYDVVKVRWKDSKRRTRLTTRTATEGLLVRLGISRTGSLDLADELGSLEMAQQAGDQFLADHAEPPNIGSLRVARRIIDLDTGRLTGPSHIRSGNLIRVRGVEAYPDSLNAEDNDGVTVFRIRSVEYSEDEGAAELELDAYTPDESRLIAQLARRRARKS